LKRRVVESTLQDFARVLEKAIASEETASKPGLLQTFDPAARIACTVVLIIAVTFCSTLSLALAFFFFAVALALFSCLRLGVLFKRVWLLVFAFTALIALPALFTTPGAPVAAVGSLEISLQGLRSAAMLVLRVETAVTLTTALILSTHWTALLRALRRFRIPAVMITMLAMTHRYIFLLIETASQMFESRQSRMVGKLRGSEQRRMVGQTAAVLLSKSMDLSNDVYLAMQSRGFRGEVNLLQDEPLKMLDILAVIVVMCGAGLAVWAER
jgi:cobalt/nickel transport system permease protein